jgi:predicted metalloprotease with PDZ domain
VNLSPCTAAVLFALVFSGVVAAATGPAPQLALAIDATQAPRKIFHAQLTIPATPGTLTLYYPKWIPGEHAPSGPMIDSAGITFSANGEFLKWRRMLADAWAINVEVPAGVHEVDASLDFLSEPERNEELYSSGASATEKLAVISWNQLLLYPKGWSADQITFTASLRIPQGWKFGTALPVSSQTGNQIRFSPVSLYTLIDSPVITGQYLKVTRLNEGQTPPVELDVAADSAMALEPPDEVWDHYKNVVKQAFALFGATHYRDYHFLFSLSNHVAHFGLEHHESNDSREEERTLIDPELRLLHAPLLTHEYVHSWNGKYRRPADLTTPDYEQTMQDDLLWVYEGLTEYLGDVLAARSGLWTADEYRDHLAQVAALMYHRSGRAWRNLQDTADSASVLYFAPHEWVSWRRDTDFYEEGELDWLWADAIIRQQSKNRKSIDDFCHLFHGPPNTPPMVKPYTFDDVVSALNQIVPYDWRGFWTDRLTTHQSGALLGGVEGSGWKLAYDANRSEIFRAWEEDRHLISASFSVGLTIREDGEVVDAIENTDGARAGIGPGMTVLAVNGRRFTPQVFRDALAAGLKDSEPLELIIENTDYIRTFKLDYHGGEKYPHLVRNEQPDLLSDIVRAH